MRVAVNARTVAMSVWIVANVVASMIPVVVVRVKLAEVAATVAVVTVAAVIAVANLGYL